MPNFHELEIKFGEVVAQAILENLERFEGVRNDVSCPWQTAGTIWPARSSATPPNYSEHYT